MRNHKHVREVEMTP